jgi:hypothetical protein
VHGLYTYTHTPTPDESFSKNSIKFNFCSLKAFRCCDSADHFLVWNKHNHFQIIDMIQSVACHLLYCIKYEYFMISWVVTAQWYSAGLRAGWSAGDGNFSLHHRVQTGSGAHPASYSVPGALSLWVKWPGREVDHSPPSNAEVKKVWSYTSTPQYVFMAWCLVKHREDFTFTLLND